MRKAKDDAGTVKKRAAKRAGPKKVTAVEPPPSRARSKARKPPAVRTPKPAANAETSISEAQSNVVASKFRTDPGPAKRTLHPPLPVSYGESHLLLLVRDPQTLFAAWDVSPATVGSLKARLGSRAFAVSTLTLRLTRAGGGTSVIHIGKKARSRYIKIEGGPSFLAEIGFTTPTGRFELVARSAPCFVPMGPIARQDSIETGRRAVLGYREARAVARRSLTNPSPGGLLARPRPRPGGATAGVNGPLESSAPRVLGGASDLYRR